VRRGHGLSSNRVRPRSPRASYACGDVGARPTSQLKQNPSVEGERLAITHALRLGGGAAPAAINLIGGRVCDGFVGTAVLPLFWRSRRSLLVRLWLPPWPSLCSSLR